MLGRAGYRTAAIVSSLVLGPETGIGIGFDSLDAPPPRPRRGRPASATARLATDWLQAQRDGGFFLWVHLFDPHDPYDPPDEYRRIYRTDEGLKQFIRDTAVPERHWREALEVNNLYDGEVRFADAGIGQILGELKRLGFYEKSLIVLTADHGEGLLQHSIMQHGIAYNEQLDIPLIVKFPQGRGPAPARIEKLVSLIDVLPMIAEELDMPLDRDQFDGVNPLAADRKYVLAEREYARNLYGDVANYVLRDRRWKYFYFSEGDDALYDLESDYRETRNVIGEQPAIAGMMKKELLSQVRRYRERGADLEIRRDAVSDEVREQLKSLGYVD